MQSHCTAKSQHSYPGRLHTPRIAPIKVNTCTPFEPFAQVHHTALVVVGRRPARMLDWILDATTRLSSSIRLDISSTGRIPCECILLSNPNEIVHDISAVKHGHGQT
jgi:hypothetical protein